VSDVLFYATADTHAPEEADGGAWRSLRAVRGDAVYGIARLAALCLEDGVPMVIAGDLFDGPDPAPDAQGAVYEALAPMLKAGLAVYYNLGNHDRGRDWLAPLARLGLPVRRVDGNVYRDPAGFTVTGLSYVPPASFAEAVRQILIKDYGIDANRLTAKGYGPTQPIADNKTAAGRQANRRVVATVTAEE
jgi:hypothetical protein